MAITTMAKRMTVERKRRMQSSLEGAPHSHSLVLGVETRRSEKDSPIRLFEAWVEKGVPGAC